MKHQKVIKKLTETEQSKIMYKYAQLKRFYQDRRLQVYIYDLMCVYPETIPVEDHFIDTKLSVVNYKKMSTPGPVLKIGLDLVTYFQNMNSWLPI